MGIKIINDFNIRKQARELGVDIWHAPGFLFIVMGVVTIIAIMATYLVAQSYSNLEILVISESVVVITIFSVGNSVISSIEQIARLNKMKSEFLGIASHQLRTPLSAIKWQIEIILSRSLESLTARQKREIVNIQRLSERMTKIVNDLLDVVKIDQGKLISKKEKVDVAKAVRETVRGVELLAKAKKIKVIFKAEKAKSFWAIADFDKLKIVIENLIVNSIKYSKEKGKVEVQVLEEAGNIIVGVKDYGMGIPDSQHRQVFDKFFRSDNAAKYQTEGAGLGLYIAKNIIKQSEGKIWFESKENVGTNFKLSLPKASFIAQV